MRNKILNLIVLVFFIFAAGCSNMLNVLDSGTVKSGTKFSLPMLGGGSRDARLVDVNSDGKVDGIDLDGDITTAEIKIAEIGPGAFSVDLNSDSSTDFYFSIDGNGAVSFNTKKDGSGTAVKFKADASGSLTGADTTGDGSVDCAVSAGTAPPADTSAADAAADKAALDTGDFSFSGSENADAVKSDFTVPTGGSNGSTISWSSSNTAAISMSGGTASVTMTSSDVTVVLTATIVKGSVSLTKNFSITVKKKPLPAPPEGTGAECKLEDVTLAVSSTTPAGGKNITGMGGMNGTQSALVIGNYAWVSSYEHFYRIDVSDPANPTSAAKKVLKAGGQSLFSMDGVAIDDYIFFTNGTGGTTVLYVGDPDNPVIVKTFEVYAQQLVIDEGRLYMLDQSRKFWVFDISNPWNPVELGSLTLTIESSNFQMAVNDKTAYIAGGSSGDRLCIVDVSDPSSLTKLYGGDLGGKLSYTKSIAWADDHVFMYDFNNRTFFSIDVSDKSAPVIVKEVDDYDEMALRNNLYYVDGNVLWGFDSQHGIIDKFDISDPSSPVKLGELKYGPDDTLYDPAAVYKAIVGKDYFFISCNDGGTSGVDELVIFPKN